MSRDAQRFRAGDVHRAAIRVSGDWFANAKRGLARAVSHRAGRGEMILVARSAWSRSGGRWRGWLRNQFDLYR